MIVDERKETTGIRVAPVVVKDVLDVAKSAVVGECVPSVEEQRKVKDRPFVILIVGNVSHVSVEHFAEGLNANRLLEATQEGLRHRASSIDACGVRAGVREPGPIGILDFGVGGGDILREIIKPCDVAV